MGALGHLAAIPVRIHRTGIAGIFQAFPVIAQGQGQLLGNQALGHQIHGHLVRHFPHHQPGLFEGIGL